MKISIVIPVYNHFDLLNDLMVNVVTRSGPYEVILVDDNSTDKATIDGIQWWRQNFKGIVNVIQPESNLGFLRASNRGMNSATGDVLCLISTDVVVEDDICRILDAEFSKKTRILVGGVVYKESTGWNQFGQQVFPYAEGWLLACTRENWLTWGGFDERYAPNDFEDVDLSTTALSDGAELVSLNNPKIRHIGAQSIGYNEQREEITKRNRKRFEEKWLKPTK